MAQASRRTLRLFTAFAVLALLLASGAGSALPSDMEVNTDTRRTRTARRNRRIGHARARGRACGGDVRQGARPRRLEGGRRPESKASKQAAEQAQGNVLGSLDASGIDATPLYQVQTAYNGIAVQAAPGTVAELAELPGVKAVHEIPLVELDNHSSVPLITALQAWGSFGNTGTGMSIAVIDTGIDYVHRGFAGSGSSPDYLVARSAGGEPAGS